MLKIKPYQFSFLHAPRSIEYYITKSETMKCSYLNIRRSTKSSLYFLLLLAPIISLLGCKNQAGSAADDNVRFVDPLIGSGGHGHVFVGASVPHGMVQVGPNNLSKGWDWCSGYHDSDTTIIGFAQTHLSGTGIADLGDVLFMPTGNFKQPSATDTTRTASFYYSTFNKKNQKVSPGYYSVNLNRYNIKVELTATERCSFQTYSYPKDSAANVVINLAESVQSLMARKGTTGSSLTIINDTTVAGFRSSDEWARDHKVYFVSVFSKPIVSKSLLKGQTSNGGKTATSTEGVVSLLSFKNDGKPLSIKTGISYTSTDGAALNLKSEIKSWDFAAIKNEATSRWNSSLASFNFKSKDSLTKVKFYTALYHTQISPSLFSDADGKYRGADGKVYSSNSNTYSVFSLWDTYRAVHPLYTLTDTAVSSYANTLLQINSQQKRMPVWHLAGNETDCMVGVHSIPVVIDAYLKGFNIDKEKLWNAVKDFDQYDQNGLKAIRERGYIPADQEVWSVAKGLEYAIDYDAIAKLAKDLGYKAEAEKYAKLAKSYQQYFDKQSGFMRGKLANGRWRANFNPYHSLHLEDDYVEGNAWQYTWLVPQDVEGLVGLFGGKAPFTKKLDSLFTVSSALNEGASIDITGMIGQFAHGNEPSHHISYLYPFVGQQWKTAEKVRQVCNQFYKASPDGLIGNEDCGQMSAWYIFSALGFYQVNPVNGLFVFGSPLADEVEINLNNGKKFKITAQYNSAKNKFIQSVKLNGKAYTKTYIKYQQIMEGGELIYVMGSKPNYNYGKEKADWPVSNPSKEN